MDSKIKLKKNDSIRYKRGSNGRIDLIDSSDNDSEASQKILKNNIHIKNIKVVVPIDDQFFRPDSDDFIDNDDNDDIDNDDNDYDNVSNSNSNGNRDVFPS